MLMCQEPEEPPALFKVDPENTSLAKAYKDVDVSAMWQERVKAHTDATDKIDRKVVSGMTLALELTNDR